MAKLITRREGAVGWVVFSNPARFNAMTYDMWKALPEALASLDADPEVRLVVLAGDGDKAFVSGADVSQFDQARATPKEQEAYNQNVEAAYLAPTLAAKPVVAKIRGICMGGGLGLAAACDVRFAADDAVFRMPAARLGLGYSFVGMRRFVHVLGAANAADIFFSARKFDARDALAMGLVSRVFAAADFDREVDAYCRMVAENAPLTLVTAKTAIREVLKDAAARDLDALQRQIDACYASADYAEGRAAFKEKRAPRFRGV
ncbi:MAG: enoyl-CoA hydratase/isomerase family protein [Burkholderiales bacterium]|nr:enoyl-CoA hydratase/isomerase family protein [Burkholderiales bacterium]